MKYYTIVKNNGIYDKFIIESNVEVALICFCDDDLDNIYQCFRQSCEVEKTIFDNGIMQVVVFEFIGEDNWLYRINYKTDEVSKEFKWPLKKLFKQYKNSEKTSIIIKEKKENILKNYKQDTIVNNKTFISNYKKYTFIDKENLMSIAFRFKKSSKNEKMPLVIYFHGAGALGDDNIKQLWEYKNMGLYLSKKRCHVLVPQGNIDIGNNISIIIKYCKAIKKLVEKLSEYAEIDYSRIYIVGASYGGACAWYSLYECPNFYAAAIPLMGYFPTYNSEQFDVKKFENEKIWIGHAENDKAVSIKDDETMFKMLDGAGYNVKMTRYKKFGHKMCGIFLRREKWKRWLFKQKLQH